MNNKIPCPRCGQTGGIETKDFRRFYRCYSCGYYDYAKIALSKSQKKKNDDFYKIYEKAFNEIGIQINLI